MKMNESGDKMNYSRAVNEPNIGPTPHSSHATMHSSSLPPPLPPRPNANQFGVNPNRYPNYGANAYGLGSSMGYAPNSYCNSFYGGLGSYALNRFNGYGGFGNFSNGAYGGVGANYGTDNDFVRLAEDSSRQAFQSIESIVQAFGSVAMMLESTYLAVHSSFRAVIGVADHFSRLRNHLSQIVSNIAIIRTLRWILRRLLYLIGYAKHNNEDNETEMAWSDANNLNSRLNGEAIDSLTNIPAKHRSSWPILIFFSVVLGTPWLIWTLLSKISGNEDKIASDKWITGEDEHYDAITLYDFQAANSRELSFKSRQKIIIAPRDLQPKVKGWLLASDSSKKVGLIPANYVRINGYLNPKIGDTSQPIS